MPPKGRIKPKPPSRKLRTTPSERSPPKLMSRTFFTWVYEHERWEQKQPQRLNRFKLDCKTPLFFVRGCSRVEPGPRCYLSGLFAGHHPARGSAQEVFTHSRVQSSRVRSCWKTHGSGLEPVISRCIYFVSAGGLIRLASPDLSWQVGWAPVGFASRRDDLSQLVG